MAENTEVKTDAQDNAQGTPDTQAGAGAPTGEATQDKEKAKAAKKAGKAQAGAGAEAQETAKEAKTKGKVYKFVSDNKFLTCTSLGVQFINGKAETESLEVAKVLATLSGVTLVEE